MRIGQDHGHIFIVPLRDSGIVHVRSDVEVLHDQVIRNIPFLRYVYVWEEEGKVDWNAFLQDGRTCFSMGAMWDPKTSTMRTEGTLKPESARIAKEYLTANERGIGTEVTSAFKTWKKTMEKERANPQSSC